MATGFSCNHCEEVSLLPDRQCPSMLQETECLNHYHNTMRLLFPLSSNFFKFIMYADDTTLYSQFDNARIANHDIELEINNELTNINDWLKINKLALNIKNI